MLKAMSLETTPYVAKSCDVTHGCPQQIYLSWLVAPRCHETADSAGGDPALKPHNSDSYPQLHKKTIFKVVHDGHAPRAE